MGASCAYLHTRTLERVCLQTCLSKCVYEDYIYHHIITIL